MSGFTSCLTSTSRPALFSAASFLNLISIYSLTQPKAWEHLYHVQWRRQRGLAIINHRSSLFIHPNITTCALSFNPNPHPTPLQEQQQKNTRAIHLSMHQFQPTKSNQQQAQQKKPLKRNKFALNTNRLGQHLNTPTTQQLQYLQIRLKFTRDVIPHLDRHQRIKRVIRQRALDVHVFRLEHQHRRQFGEQALANY